MGQTAALHDTCTHVLPSKDMHVQQMFNQLNTPDPAKFIFTLKRSRNRRCFYSTV